jgi:hypothetical protein
MRANLVIVDNHPIQGFRCETFAPGPDPLEQRSRILSYLILIFDFDGVLKESRELQVAASGWPSIPTLSHRVTSLACRHDYYILGSYDPQRDVFTPLNTLKDIVTGFDFVYDYGRVSIFSDRLKRGLAFWSLAVQLSEKGLLEALRKDGSGMAKRIRYIEPG